MHGECTQTPAQLEDLVRQVYRKETAAGMNVTVTSVATGLSEFLASYPAGMDCSKPAADCVTLQESRG